MSGFHDLSPGDEIARKLYGYRGGYEIGRVERTTDTQVLVLWPGCSHPLRYRRKHGYPVGVRNGPELVRVTPEIRESVELQKLESWIMGLARAVRLESPERPSLDLLRALKRAHDAHVNPCESCHGENKNPGVEPHTCPYSEELYDSDAECNCCGDCTEQCRGAI